MANQVLQENALLLSPDGAHDHAGHDHTGHSTGAGNDAIDPVCGMTVDKSTAKHRTEHDGKPYFFCGAGCATKFTANPAKYLAPRVAEVVPEGTMFTCPMHPQIRQPGPGSCPICGMALEPEVPSADAGPNHELIDFTRRFWIGLTLALPVFVLEMASHFFDLPQLHRAADLELGWSLVLSTPVVLWAGWPFFQRGWQSHADT